MEVWEAVVPNRADWRVAMRLIAGCIGAVVGVAGRAGLFGAIIGLCVAAETVWYGGFPSGGRHGAIFGLLAQQSVWEHLLGMSALSPVERWVLMAKRQKCNSHCENCWLAASYLTIILSVIAGNV